MAHYGVLLGCLLLVAVTVLAFALAAKATSSVKHFREEHHEPFVSRRDK